ncbi:GAF domain-containing protein [Candidatus Villigracilis affinis]|uniref:GAF domain-containing protein n=1 Tax=Candidatus Villigracilis affinis TaxID=3140682 RepID=UPI001D6BAD37|nr:GAF domain-containing protein [Anaerolineales bacterium]
MGADKQTVNAQRVWKLTASLLSGHSAVPNQPFLPDLQSGLASDLPLAIEKVLNTIVQTVPCQGAWLAIRRGESLDIQAEWNDSKAKNLSLLIDTNPILRRVNRSLTELIIPRGHPNWETLPVGPMKPATKVWVGLPLVIGQRLIGVIALWRQSEFSRNELGQLRDLASRVSPSVEVLVTFSEMAAHLRRLGLLNDFVLTVSSAQSLDQVARRMFGLLARAFNTELIALFLRSSDGRVLRDYRMLEGKLNVLNVSLAGHSIQPVLKEARVRRVMDAVKDGLVPVFKGARSVLIVPLKYRGQAIGVLIIENLHAEAFSQYDEHLMVVITSHMAGLIEYTRLREEAEGRARSLGLIHEVVQQVIGLNDKKEVAHITAELVAQYFKYELAAILLVDDTGTFFIQGIGGTQAATVQMALAEHQNNEFIIPDGVTGYVSRTGESVLTNDTNQEKLYKPIKGWEAHSEICVALKDGENILGIIDVESREQNAFSHNDLIAMESLAGILASVISSANQYQKLQETIRQLRAIEIELNSRMEAQRSAENRLIQAAKLAAVGEMAAGIAHELNNPLTTVTGFSELVLEELPADSAHRDDLEMVLREARRASDVVHRLLDFSRQGERIRTRADLNEVVNDVIALTRHLIQTNGVNLTLELSDSLPWVSIDRNQMKQVLLNLIHNALQAMPKGGELFVNTASAVRAERDWVIMAVKDSGIGILPINQDRIFEPFFTTKGDSGGTGLGLSVTYGIVTDHGGSIDISSEPDKGSTFTVWLPI